MKPTIEINETNFEREVIQSNLPVLVDFWAEWCGPCKMLAPLLDEIATEEAGHVKVARVNVDTNPALAARYGIQSIPTLLYFAAAKCGTKTIGVTGKRAIVVQTGETRRVGLMAKSITSRGDEQRDQLHENNSQTKRSDEQSKTVGCPARRAGHAACAR